MRYLFLITDEILFDFPEFLVHLDFLSFQRRLGENSFAFIDIFNFEVLINQVLEI